MKKLHLQLACMWTVIIAILFTALQINHQETVIIGSVIDTITVVKKEEFKQVKMSERGKEFIKSHESLSSKAVILKGEKLRTIGYGHQIRKTDPLWLQQKYVGDEITKKQAEEIFDNDMANFLEPAINRLYKELWKNGVNTNKLPQGFTDAFGSLIYNCGESGIRNTEFFKQLKKGNLSKAISLIPTTHVYYPGHKTRRINELNMMKASFYAETLNGIFMGSSAS